MTNVNTYDGWIAIFKNANINNISLIKGKDFRGSYFDMLKDEGVVNTFKIIHNSLKDRKIRQRMKLMNKFFSENDEYFGYGIYYYVK